MKKFRFLNYLIVKIIIIYTNNNKVKNVNFNMIKKLKV